MYVYVAKYKYGHICTTCMTHNTCKVTRVIHTFMYNSGVESSCGTTIMIIMIIIINYNVVRTTD